MIQVVLDLSETRNVSNRLRDYRCYSIRRGLSGLRFLFVGEGPDTIFQSFLRSKNKILKL